MPAFSATSGSSDALSAEVLLRQLFDAAVASALPERCVPDALPDPPPSGGRTVVVGAGKAAAAMAQALDKAWRGALEGLVITPYGHAVPCERIEVREAAHPAPDRAGMWATAAMLELLDGLTNQDLVICLISGGGSSLLVAPPPGVTLDDLQTVSQALLRSGATIAQMNCVRKHLSLVAGGRLAQRAAPARLATLAISDVPGDDPGIIASGPTVGDPTTRSDALGIIARFHITLPPAIRDWLNDPSSETPPPGEGNFGSFSIIASPQMALEAAATQARALGLEPIILGSAIEGEARDVGIVHAGIALQVRNFRQPAPAPCVLLSGGETSVSVRGEGRGGRNCEFLLGLAQALDGAQGIYALAADTDGIDGLGDNAGALVRPDTLSIARHAGWTTLAAFATCDSYGFFNAVNALIHTGPTLTNVNDFRAILVEAAAH